MNQFCLPQTRTMNYFQAKLEKKVVNIPDPKIEPNAIFNGDVKIVASFTHFAFSFVLKFLILKSTSKDVKTIGKLIFLLSF